MARLIDQGRTLPAHPLLPEERRRLITEIVGEDGRVTVEALEGVLGISAMTVRRDLTVLEREGSVRRIYGGAVLPELSSHEDSFSFRLGQEQERKQRLAAAAVRRLKPGESVFIDGSTTAYFAAELIIRQDLGMTILTNALPIMSLFSRSEVRRTELIGIGGALRKLTLSLIGSQAVEAASAYFADKALMSCKGITSDGHVTEPTPAEAEIKRLMIARAEEPILLVDGTKFDHRGLSVVGEISDFRVVIATDVPERRLEELHREGIEVERA